FDEVVSLLIQKIERKALIELSERVAPVENAPIKVVHTLAYDDEIDVARPVLTYSARLRTEDLVAIAKSKSRKHLLAISARRRLDGIVTDVLLNRGDREVMKTLVDNPGAQFSKAGLTLVASSAEQDEMIADGLGRRLDIPLAIFEQLLTRATETVRMRLLSVLTPKDNDQFHDAVAAAANEVRAEMSAPRDVAQTLLTLLQMQKNGSLDESTVL